MRLLLLLWSLVGVLAAQDIKPFRVIVLDSQHNPISGAAVDINGLVPISTSEAGLVTFTELKPGAVEVVVSKQNFQQVHKTVTIASGAEPSTLEMILLPASHREEVNVEGSADRLDTASAGQHIPTALAKELPARPAKVSDALPLIPGISRSPEGGLTISGSGEQRSALIVNSADVTDPATGQFGTTIPIDSVETLNVLQTPFQAEYGRFTSALVSVETRRGGDKWKAEVNDPLPDFRIRSYHLRGIRDATPRLNFEGPLLRNKLFFSEGFEYEVRKTPVLTLAFPNNQQLKEGLNSFSQFDYILSQTHLLTATLHQAPTKLEAVDLSTFNPRSTTPDASLRDYTGTIADHLTLWQGDLLENTLSYTRFVAHIWGHGTQDLVITPSGNEGNYFAQQRRDSSRMSVSSTYSLHALDFVGEHHLKAGAYFAPSAENGQIIEQPFSIIDSSGKLLRKTSFIGGSPVLRRDTEIAIFGQDHWLVTPRFAVDAGVRSESQQLTETFRLAPRAGFAWTPLGQQGPVIRAGAGLFYDRVPLDVFSFAQYPQQVITSYTSSGDLISGPTTYTNALGEVVSRNPFLFHERVVGDFSPRSTTWSAQVEQQVSRYLKMKAAYEQNISAGLITLHPIAPKAGSSLGTVLLTGDSLARYRQFEVSGRVRLQGDKQQLFFSYVKSVARGDLNDFGNYLGSFPAPVIRPNRFGNLAGDLPHRFLTWGVLHLPSKFQIAPIFEWRTGLPYSVIDAAQAYVGKPNSQRFPNFLSLDARLSRDFKINAKYSVRFSVSANNVTNHFNPDSVYSNTDAALYGQFLGQHKRRFMADFDFLF